MRRWLSLLRQEAKLAARDRALAGLLVIFALFAAYGAWTGAQWRAERAATVAAVTGELAEAMDNKREQFAKAAPGEIPFAAMPQVTPFRPVLEPGPLAALSIGQAEAYPYAARMLPLGDETMFDAFRLYVDNPAMKAAGRFDLALVIVVLMPLLILAGAYDLWVRDRERGVGAMSLAQPVSPLALLAAKALARGLLVLLPVSAMVAIALALVAHASPAGLAAAVLTVLLYGLFWIALALVVNVLVRRATEAAVVCGVLWLVIVALGPALALAAVDDLRPAPSAIARTNALRDIYLQHRTELTARPPQVEPDPAPRIPERLRVFRHDQARLEARKAPVLAAFDQALARRRDLLDATRLVLPSVAAQDALDRIAGSDADRALAFQGQVFAFRGETRQWLAARFDADAPLVLADYTALPVFRFEEPAQGRDLAIDWTVLGLASALLSALAALVLRRRHPLES